MRWLRRLDMYHVSCLIIFAALLSANGALIWLQDRAILRAAQAEARGPGRPDLFHCPYWDGEKWVFPDVKERGLDTREP